ncbi:MAG: hypothetical protein ACXV5D_00015 [Halobacteriota archaeon]
MAIETIQSVLFNNKIEERSKIQNNGPGVIRTHDLRHVKTEVLEHTESFSDPSVALFDGSFCAITTKNASDPWCSV